MRKKVDVIMPSLGKQGDTTIRSLERFAPFEFRVITSKVPGWSNAVNKCLEHHELGNDLLIIDDDVEVLPSTFEYLPKYLDKADIFGFKLFHPGFATIQHDGGWVDETGAGHIFNENTLPSYVGYVTASLCYIKEPAMQAFYPLKVWPGLQWEDVALCVDAWQHGFKVAYLPFPAIHKETATKRDDPKLHERWLENKACFLEYYGEDALKALASKFGARKRIPID